MNRIFKYYKNRKGITLVLMAFMLAVLLMFAGLAIDIAYMYYVKNQLQVAADASSLAGVARLDGKVDNVLLNPNVLEQLEARQEAWKFACKNTAAGQSVFLVTNSSLDCNAPPASDLNETSNTSTEDIVVGHWSTTPPSSVTCEPAGSGYFCPATGSTGLAINAIKTRPRRSGTIENPDTPGMPQVRVFIGQIFRIINADWTFMSARASAIAARKPLAVPGVPLCVGACTLSTPINLLIAEGPGPTCTDTTLCLTLGNRMAFTAFSDKQAPNVGTNGDVVDYIWGRKPLPSTLCELCITTNNTGGGGAALRELSNAFNDKVYKHADKTFDSGGNVSSWRVAVPIVDRKCSVSADPCGGCPPGCQGNNEPYHVQQIATIVITAVTDTGPAGGRGITIASVNCVGCPTSLPLGNEVGLVK